MEDWNMPVRVLDTDTSHFRRSNSDPEARHIPPQKCLDHSPTDVDRVVLLRRQTCHFPKKTSFVLGEGRLKHRFSSSLLRGEAQNEDSSPGITDALVQAEKQSVSKWLDPKPRWAKCKMNVRRTSLWSEWRLAESCTLRAPRTLTHSDIQVWCPMSTTS